MSASDSPKTRRDGWTPERQLRFLDILARTRSVSSAARAAGMSRESAYRLRKRDNGGLFTAAWDRALEGHTLARPALLPRKSAHRISRGNPPKVTKWMKCTVPRFDPLEKLLRDFRAGAV